MDLRIKIILGIFCFFLINCGSFAYEINGNTVTQTPDGGTKIELSSPMHLNLIETNPIFYPSQNDITNGIYDKPLIGWEILSNPDNYNLSPYLSHLTWNISLSLSGYKFGKDGGELAVNVKILKDGSITDAKIVKSSYDKDSEKIILDTLMKTKGKVFPPQWGDKSIEVCLLFATIKNLDKQQQENISEIDFVPYLRELQRRIELNWKPQQEQDKNPKRISVLMTIMKDGRLEKCKIFQSSGDKQADKAAWDAVYMTAPFRPLPQEYKGKSIDILFSFEQKLSVVDNQDSYFKNPSRGISTAELEPYLEKMRKQIRYNLKLPVDHTAKAVTVLVNIKRDGSLVNCIVFKSSGNEKLDKAVIEAVYRTAPFKPLPKEYNAEILNFSFTHYPMFRR